MGALMSKQYLILNDQLGSSSPELAALLMKNFLYALARSEEVPERIIFMNRGVYLTCEGSESLEDLTLLAEKGVAIKSCGTCLNYYELTDKLKVGEVGVMPDAVAATLSGSEVITLC